MKPTKPYTNQNPAKKLKLSEDEDVEPRCLNNNVVSNSNEKKLKVDVEDQKKQPIPVKIKKKAVSVIDLTLEEEDEDENDILKTCKYLCDCDECKHVTAGHKMRSLGGLIKIKCRCHPCTLRTEIEEMGFLTDPFEVIKMKPDMTDAEKLIFWRGSWLNNLFADIVDGRLDVKTASMIIGSNVVDIEKKLKLFNDKKRWE